MGFVMGMSLTSSKKGVIWINIDRPTKIYSFYTNPWDLGCRETIVIVCQRNSLTTWYTIGYSV